ncbi:MAG: ABC transporter permease [Phycisphaerales bacterium]|nr:MAG: ABC transporter permease [Phycisphaerales bacterium]
MTQIWAVARQMVAEGIRMKIALVFLGLMGMVVLGLPFSISGDSSVTGAVQSFMSYGLSATGVLLGMLTIFMSRSLSDELVNRHVYLVLTKPIPRWQFLMGKWIGMMALNAAFLAFSGLAIWGMVHYIKRTHPPIDEHFDMRELDDQVLVARHPTKVTVPDFGKLAEQEFERNREQGVYVNVPDFKPGQEMARLRNKYEARWRLVPPYDSRTFEFKKILCDRSPDKYIQLRYKTEVIRYPTDEIFRSVWRFGNPYKGTPLYESPTRHVVGRYHTIPIRADAVAPDHTLTVQFYNYNPFEGETQAYNIIEFRAPDGPEVLFVVGSFEWNLIRTLILMLCKLTFLAAVALLMTTVFSFPVACLASFTIYVLSGSRSFITEAFDYISDDRAGMFSSLNEFVIQSIAYVYNMIHWVLPSFSRYDAVETFVNGRNVSLVWVLQALSELVLLKTTIIIGLAILLFHRREVAETSI